MQTHTARSNLCLVVNADSKGSDIYHDRQEPRKIPGGISRKKSLSGSRTGAIPRQTSLTSLYSNGLDRASGRRGRGACLEVRVRQQQVTWQDRPARHLELRCGRPEHRASVVPSLPSCRHRYAVRAGRDWLSPPRRRDLRCGRARPGEALTRVERGGAWPLAKGRWQPGPTPDVQRHGAGSSDWPDWRGAPGGAEGSGGLAGSGSFRRTGI